MVAFSAVGTRVNDVAGVAAAMTIRLIPISIARTKFAELFMTPLSRLNSLD
jgi:hypothetical protein